MSPALAGVTEMFADVDATVPLGPVTSGASGGVVSTACAAVGASTTIAAPRLATSSHTKTRDAITQPPGPEPQLIHDADVSVPAVPPVGWTTARRSRRQPGGTSQ